MALLALNAQPYPVTFDPKHTALLMIDMQRDFLEEGGFGAMLGNDVQLLRQAIQPCQQLLNAARKYNLTVIHTREGHHSSLHDVTTAKMRRGRSVQRIGDVGAMGRILIRGEEGH